MDAFQTTKNGKMEVGIGLTPPVLTQFPQFPVSCLVSEPKKKNRKYVVWPILKKRSDKLGALEMVDIYLYCLLQIFHFLLAHNLNRVSMLHVPQCDHRTKTLPAPLLSSTIMYMVVIYDLTLESILTVIIRLS